jgi:hypothetical protein
MKILAVVQFCTVMTVKRNEFINTTKNIAFLSSIHKMSQITKTLGLSFNSLKKLEDNS